MQGLCLVSPAVVRPMLRNLLSARRPEGHNPSAAGARPGMPLNVLEATELLSFCCSDLQLPQQQQQQQREQAAGNASGGGRQEQAQPVRTWE